MRWVALVAVLVGCEWRKEPPAPAAPDAAVRKFARRSPRSVGCRERTMRLSMTMCEFNNLWVPTADATPDDLRVAATEGITVDACLRTWEQLSKRCDGETK
jgi:hypothetical protein